MAEENDSDSASKTEEPTRRRLEEARANGDIPKSADVASFATLASAGAVLVILGGLAARQMTERLLPFIARPDSIDLSGEGGIGVAQAAARAAEPMGWVLGAVILAAIAGNVLQQGFVWTTGKLAPDPSRLSPMQGFKRLFGIDGLVHFGKSLLKVLGLGFVCWIIVLPRASALQNLSSLKVAAILPLSADVFKALLIAVLVLLAVIALADFVWQRQRFMHRLRMTKEEIKEDTKQSEGDPHIKAKLRQQRMQRSRRRIIQMVPQATMVVMNPTHYAVALRYVQGETAAPVCVAKGLDNLALKIREVAEAHDIAVIEDPPLARALYAAMEIDQVIPREHFEAVAKIVGFVLGRGKGGANRSGGARRAPPLRPSKL
jgi:flagellar biosynthetic protein FlhB